MCQNCSYVIRRCSNRKKRAAIEELSHEYRMVSSCKGCGLLSIINNIFYSIRVKTDELVKSYQRRHADESRLPEINGLVPRRSLSSNLFIGDGDNAWILAVVYPVLRYGAGMTICGKPQGIKPIEIKITLTTKRKIGRKFINNVSGYPVNPQKYYCGGEWSSGI